MSDPTGLTQLNALRERMVRWGQMAPESVKKALMYAADVVIGTSRRDFFAKGGGYGGPLLHTRSGRLWRSIHKTVEVKGVHQIKAEIGSNVVYARIHELGGTIRPVHAEFLRFPIKHLTMVPIMSGKRAGQERGVMRTEGWVSVKQVTIPPRPYLSTALAKERLRLPRIILARLMAEMTKKMHRGMASG